MSEHSYEQDYIKGFNVGYIMAKYVPTLAAKIVEVKGHRWMDGFEYGHMQAVFDKADRSREGWESMKRFEKALRERPDKEEDKEIDEDIDKE